MPVHLNKSQGISVVALQSSDKAILIVADRLLPASRGKCYTPQFSHEDGAMRLNHDYSKSKSRARRNYKARVPEKTMPTWILDSLVFAPGVSKTVSESVSKVVSGSSARVVADYA
jgi:hypothetical protein